MHTEEYKIFVDTGGTFTDCISIDAQGRRKRLKVLSNSSLRGSITDIISQSEFIIKESWKLPRDLIRGFSFRVLPGPYSGITVESFDTETSRIRLSGPLPEMPGENCNFEITSNEEAPILGIRLLTETALNEEFPPIILKLGSTTGTNALLERKGAKTLFITTAGFSDLLEIGNQSRPDIFALNVKKRSMLYSHVIELDERIDAEGRILRSLDIDKLRDNLEKIKAASYESVAVCLMNSYLNSVHENLVCKELKAMGLEYISASHNISPLIKIQSRADTTVVNAYLSPVINNYVKGIKKYTGKSQFQVMTSAGGLVQAGHFLPKDSLLSGPAGGVAGALAIGKKSGYNKLITFDMGGTSTDVSRIDGSFDYRYELEVGDARINSPAIAIETVAAGGGSVCGFDGYKLFVGPESAGAWPGPSCYGAGGPLTVTDVNLLLGRLDTGQFGIPVFISHAEKSLNKLIKEIKEKTGRERKAEDILEGFIDIANELMAGAIRKISLARGYKPSDFAMVAFGGAGGLHACDIADILGIDTVLLPRDAGLLSAYGIGNAAVERFSVKQILKDLDQVKDNLDELFAGCETEAYRLLLEEGFPVEKIKTFRKLVFMRYRGQDSCLEIPFRDMESLAGDFQKVYKDTYGHNVSRRSIEVESIRAIVRVYEEESMDEKPEAGSHQPEPSHRINDITPVYTLDSLNPGDCFKGSALLLDHFATTWLKKGWRLKIDQTGTAVLRREQKETVKRDTKTQETELELFTNRFMSIAENMGALLQRTALSVNIKERLDFSCALLDAEGRLVANAPHIPVHLGGLGVCVRELLKHFSFEEGDTIVTNHPKYGGSHLPDVTMVSPVFHKGERVAFVVNRAHHSEIGGISPGSMPPDAINLQEEGVVISPFYLVRKGVLKRDGMRKILTDYPYPSRSPEENMADLNASLAANHNGSQSLLTLINHHGRKTVTDYMQQLRTYASSRMKDTLAGFADGTYRATEHLDDGSVIKAVIRLDAGNCSIDFSGSADVNDSNMNATEAIVKSVTIYVLRLLLNEPIPLNDGLMEPVKVILPHGMLNPVFDDNPELCPAVVGGNVEISQRLTDTLLKAFGIIAASQGTMNNTLFGNDNFGYYETVCGGCGAGKGFRGADAVHHHMTNTRITDPEIMEHRYPVRLDEFSIRKGSGGKGRWRGGDGVRRLISFLEPVNLSVLTQRRLSGPYGCSGGTDGLPGCQKVIKKNGDIITLDSVQNINLDAGDSFVMETPGG
ncbi:MAG: hydantoinase B/oxoprolinase family protein, partial [Bacteroidales bacterium]|nr:hydantoinase B/oxoprolinase family protein [Bacteroidales bacterium]